MNKKFQLVLGVIVLIVIVFFLAQIKVNDRVPSQNIKTPIMQKYEDPSLGISLEYRVEPDGYTLIEQPREIDEPLDFIKFISLENTQAYQGLLQDIKNGVPRDGNPAFSIRVFNNREDLSLKEWVQQNKWSNYGSSTGEIKEIMVGGLPGITYKVDGLYFGETYVVENDSKIYVISNDLADPQMSPTAQKDGLDILNSISFE
jgi:hypothetical protein